MEVNFQNFSIGVKVIKIRLTRIGRKKVPFYRIIATKSESKRDGRPISYLGTYDPISKEIKIDQEETIKFIKNGAQPSETVANLLKRKGLIQ